MKGVIISRPFEEKKVRILLYKKKMCFFFVRSILKHFFLMSFIMNRANYIFRDQGHQIFQMNWPIFFSGPSIGHDNKRNSIRFFEYYKGRRGKKANKNGKACKVRYT